MKKLNKILIVLLGIVIIQSCTEPGSYPIYYQIKNETGSDVFIKFYYSGRQYVKRYDYFDLKKDESSETFYTIVRERNVTPMFIITSDSIDVYINDSLMIRYMGFGYNDNENMPKKSLYYEHSYDTIIKSKEGYDVRLYRMRMSDFE